jgi:hypothetical protein
MSDEREQWAKVWELVEMLDIPDSYQGGPERRIVDYVRDLRKQLADIPRPQESETCGLLSGFGGADYACVLPKGHEVRHRNRMGHEWVAKATPPRPEPSRDVLCAKCGRTLNAPFNYHIITGQEDFGHASGLAHHFVPTAASTEGAE